MVWGFSLGFCFRIQSFQGGWIRRVTLLLQQGQWLPAARVMRSTLSRLLLDGGRVTAAQDEEYSISPVRREHAGGFDAALALLVRIMH